MLGGFASLSGEKIEQPFFAVHFVRTIARFPDAVRADDHDIAGVQGNRLGLAEFGAVHHAERHARILQLGEFAGSCVIPDRGIVARGRP